MRLVWLNLHHFRRFENARVNLDTTASRRTKPHSSRPYGDMTLSINSIGSG